MAKLQLTIGGMHCDHCVGAVRQALHGVAGVERADVEIGKASVVYDAAHTGPLVICAAVAAAGAFSVESFEVKP